MKATRPPQLVPGKTIGVAAPASCFDRQAFDQGVRWLRSRGFEVEFRNDIFERYHYLAGGVSRRLAELNALLRDPNIDAVFFARGGYGSLQLLPDLDLEVLSRQPKIVLGHSDLTPLLNLIVARAGLVSFHGPLVTGLLGTEEQSLVQMLQVLEQSTGGARQVLERGAQTLATGLASGPLCGGNLTLLATTVGTPFELETRGCILCLEEVGERPFRVDRLLQQLAFAGKFDGVRGVAIGQMIGCEEADGQGRPLADIFAQHLEPLGIPVVFDLPFGHGAHNDTLPLGVLAEIDGARGTLAILQPAVS